MSKQVLRQVLCTLLLLCIGLGTVLTEEKELVFFIGDSHIATGNWQSYYPNQQCITQGYPGKRIAHLARRLSDVQQYVPDKLFVEIGINDLMGRAELDYLEDQYRTLFDELVSLPAVYIISLLPVSADHHIKNSRIVEVNKLLTRLCEEYDYLYIDAHSEMLGKDDALASRYSSGDGLHLNRAGYENWAEILRPFVEGSWPVAAE